MGITFEYRYNTFVLPIVHYFSFETSKKKHRSKFFDNFEKSRPILLTQRNEKYM